MTERKPRQELATVTDSIASTEFDADGNMRRQAGEHAEGWRARFLESFSAEVQNRAKNDKSAELVIETARDILYQMLEEEAWRLVFEPPQRPIYQRGELVGFEPVVQSKHVQWMLERHLPERYHLATKAELSGKGGVPLSFSFAMGTEEIEEGEFSDAE